MEGGQEARGESLPPLSPPGKKNWWFGVTMPKCMKIRTSVNILHQEKLIAQKKREIEAKMEQQAKQTHLTSQQSSQASDDESSDGKGSVSNKFANDGSFLQQFLKLQKEKSGSGPSCSSTEASATHAPPAKKLPLTGKRPNLNVSSMLSQVKSYTHSKQTPVTNRLSVFQSPDEDEEEDYEQWLEIKSKFPDGVPSLFLVPSVCTVIFKTGEASNQKNPSTDSLLKVCPPEDIRTRRIVEKLARAVAEGGPELEKVALEDCKDNPTFAPEFLYYRKKLAEIWKKSQVPEEPCSSPKDDKETKDCAEKLARFVADGGPVVEMVALKNNRENQSFR
ncbi:hypothetical protein JD844_034262 [Phrynosoma platyrhinos]|uniref:SURP motif domain-containing protein n=1 Tax=Phrynosoma platyrhinos TaxID=52577 RepID=A0ABQ7T907_PHRPL|nr:hypothetical protein JD844_034262 [Phrynosoma platyrhinos]